MDSERGAGEGDPAIFSRRGRGIAVKANKEAKLVVMSGERARAFIEELLDRDVVRQRIALAFRLDRPGVEPGRAGRPAPAAVSQCETNSIRCGR